MIVVTGLMRSGTSPIARMLHQGGIIMGETQLFPVGTMDLEWEDRRIQAVLLDWLVLGKEPSRHERVRVLTEYIQHRQRIDVTSQLIDIRGWGFKTPFMAPWLDDLEQAARSTREPLSLIVCERPIGETLKSIEKHYRESIVAPGWKSIFDRVAMAQTRIEESLESVDAHRIDIRDTWSRPWLVRIGIEDYLGLELGDRSLDGIGRS